MLFSFYEDLTSHFKHGAFTQSLKLLKIKELEKSWQNGLFKSSDLRLVAQNCMRIFI